MNTSNPRENSQRGDALRNPSASERDRTQNTPSPDLQPEDAGTAASGNESSADRAQRAMKQTSRTSNERGTR